ncbi:MAG: DinB family protein [Planctomycetia bacterium]|nr:DinB family protein [Planctomycetia bacterium]
MNAIPSSANPVVTRFAEGLRDQHRQLEAILARPGLDLAWQPAPGRNSIGMLVAHNAIVEVWWLAIAAHGIADRAVIEARVRERLGLGIDDDGMPAKPDGGHPATLAGWDAARYVDLLARTRTCTREALATWRDADLDAVVSLRGKDVTRGWILYHALEHFAQHTGQVALLASLQGHGGA